MGGGLKYLKTFHRAKCPGDTARIKNEEEEASNERTHMPRTSPDRSKSVSTNDTKSLKPGDNHHTQLAYLHTVVSDKIRTAINFDNIRTVN